MPIKVPQSLKKMLEDKAYDPYRRPTEKRLIVPIEVDRISGMGPAYGNWS